MADKQRFNEITFPLVFSIAAFAVFAVANPSGADMAGRLGYAAMLGGVALVTMFVMTWLFGTGS